MRAPKRLVISPAAIALLLLAAAAATLGAVHSLEAFAGLPPCPLCLRQRVPYWWAMPLAALAFLAVHPRLDPPQWAGPAAFSALALLFLVSAGLGLQHVGVEEKWWSAGCVSAPGGSVEDLLSGLGSQTIVRCDEKTPFLFGLTLAAYNLFLSLVLAGLALMGGLKAWREPRPASQKVPADHGHNLQRQAPAAAPAQGSKTGGTDQAETSRRDP